MTAILVTGCQKEDDLQGPKPVTFDFESVPALYLAGPTSYGDNLYAAFTGTNYTSYADAGTGLQMGINADDKGVYNFWNGGVVVSQWKDKTTAGYTNQCSVYGNGGYNGSKTFAVVNGNAEVTFTESTTEVAFDHFWVTNNTYAALSMLDGDTYAKKFGSGDWFKLTVSAQDKDGNATGTPVEFYLADFRTATSPGVLKEWAKVSLTPLGEHVHKLTFALSSTDNGDYGMNTPAYFCFDNLTFLKLTLM